MRGAFDDTDLEILARLQEDARIPNAELARRVGLSAPATLQRVRRLEELGAIRGYHALLSAEKLGLGLTVFVQVGLSLHQSKPVERFRAAVAKISEVVECHNVSGEFDFLLKVVAPSMRAFEGLIRERLSQIPEVARLQSCFVLAASRAAPLLPLDLVEPD